jgi:hypothetical protein
VKVYISGPMSGYVDFNRPAFHAAAYRLRAKGYDVVNPAELDETHPMWEGATHAEFLRRDIRLLVDCDLIYLLPGWKHSKGATGEKYVADLCGIDELVDSEREVWRTFEGEPEQEPDRALTTEETASGLSVLALLGRSVQDFQTAREQGIA